MFQQVTRAVSARVATPLASSVRSRSAVAAAAAAKPVDSADASNFSAEWARAKPFHAMPGPQPYPIVGNLPRMLPGIGEFGKKDMLEMMVALRNEYGDIIKLSNIAGRKDMVILFDPKLVEKMFRSDGAWPIREGLKTILYYRTVMRKDKYDGALGVIPSQGKEWADFRSKVNQPLMQPKSARKYFAPINTVADDFVERMRNLRDENNELPADFINELYKWSLESIALVALDTRLGCLAPDLSPDSEPQRMINAVQVMFEGFYKLDLRPSLWRLVSTPMWRRLVAAFDYFYEVSEKYVHEAIAKNKDKTDREPSILERLMAEDPRVAKVMASDMLFGGVDTTSHTSASLLFHLAKHPHVQRKLGEEIRSVLTTPQSPVTEEAMDKLVYLKACLKESLRLYPITLGNMRGTQKEMVLGGYQIPKGVDIFCGHMLMCRDEKNFPRPMSFEPERWLRGSSQAHNASPFVSLPFGFGTRTCVGRRFAEMEIYTLIAKVLRNFWVEFHHGDELTFVSRSINTISLPLKFRLLEHQEVNTLQK